LLDLKGLQPAQKPFGSANRDLFVSRIGLSREIEIGCKMNDGGDSAATPLTDLG